MTAASTGFPGSRGRKDTGESKVPPAPRVHQERTAPEAKTERLDRGAWPERAVQEVYWVLEGLPALLDSAVSQDLTAKLVPKATWAPKEREGPLASRGSLDHKVWSVLKALLDHLVKKDLKAVRVWQAWVALTVLLVILGRKAPPERKEVLAILGRWGPSATLGLVV